MPIETLISRGPGNRNQFVRLHGKELADKYLADLEKVVESGSGVGVYNLAGYFKAEYNMSVAPGTIRRHLNQLTKGQLLWE